MKHGTGSLYQTGTRGKWAMRYYDANGLQHDEATGTTDRAEAARLLKATVAAVAQGEEHNPKYGRFLFEDGEALIVADYTLNEKKSLGHLKTRIKIGLKPFFRKRKLARVTYGDLMAFATARKEAGASNATIARELSALKRIYTLAVRSGALLRRPVFPAKLKEAKPRRGFFEAEAFEAVCRALPAHHRPWARLDYYSGWRLKAEILTRTWASVDRVERTIRLAPDETKNGDGRVFPYGAFPDLVAAIEACWATHERLARAGIIEPRVFVRLVGVSPQVERLAEALQDGGWRTLRELGEATGDPLASLSTLLWRLRHGRPADGRPRVGRARPPALRVERLAERGREQAYRLAPGAPVLVPTVAAITGARKAWITACADAGHAGKRPHDFRRTAIRNLTRHRVARHLAKALVGHKTDEIFARYAIVEEADLRDAAATLAGGLQAEATARAAAEAVARQKQGEVQGEVGQPASAANTEDRAKLRRVK